MELFYMLIVALIIQPYSFVKIQRTVHQKGEKREKRPKKIFEEIIAENFPNMGKRIVNHVQEAQSPRQYKPKEEYTKTHDT